MFTRRHHYKFPIPKEHLKYCLIGNHVTIHNLDFELLEEDQNISIRPAIEDESKSPALPITHLELRDEGNKTQMVITSTMPVIAAGGQMVVMIFCVFFMIASFILLFIGSDPVLTISLCAISLLVFVFFLIRLQLVYFDYIRKIRSYVKRTGDQITADVRRQLFKHKRK